MSEQKAEQTSGEPGSLGVGPASPASSEAQSQPLAATAQESAQESVQESVQSPATVEISALVPELGGAAGEIPKADAPQAAAAKSDAPQADAIKADVPRMPGKLMIMSSGDRAWDDSGAGPAKPEQHSGMFGKRRVSALAAVAVLAAMTGALGGALATSGLRQFAGEDATTARYRALETSVARIDADIANIRVSTEHTAKVGMAQFNKTSDRLDKAERAQAEPAAKLARLSDAVDKLRVAAVAAPAAVLAAPVAAAPVAAKEVTGSVAAAAVVPATPPKPEVTRLPTVEGWVLRDAANGGALIESRRGIYEVYAGDSVPGVGRVDAVRKQDGRWVVVTSKGLIVAR